MERYARQIQLPGFGIEGQRKLLGASVLVIGAGGLGCPVLQSLAGAGVGRIGIIDDDCVEWSNLHRQFLFTADDVGQPKALRAAERVRAMNPGLEVRSYPERLTVRNAAGIIARYDFVVDGSDNFATRYLVNDACVLQGKPLVYGAVSRFEGQVAVFNDAGVSGEKANYRDLFPVPPKEGEVLNCAEAGVLGVLPSIVGSMQAAEVIKLITGLGTPLSNRLWIYNLLTNRNFELQITPGGYAKSGGPASLEDFLHTDYEWACGVAPETEEIAAEALDDFLGNYNAVLLDVREYGELPEVPRDNVFRIPLSELRQTVPEIERGAVAVICQSGKRSRVAVNLLMQRFGAGKRIVSVRGGVESWVSINDYE